MLTFFEPVVAKILALLSHQIERAGRASERLGSAINVRINVRFARWPLTRVSVSCLWAVLEIRSI
jgi:hypothetical protein